jgi:MOSC domain-containing protein YiiM
MASRVRPAIARIAAIYIAPAASMPMTNCDVIEAVAGKGLAGDRYFHNAGFFSNKPGWGAQVTLVQQEAIDAVNSGHNTNFTAAMLRRNIVTTDIDLKSLVDRAFHCGDAILRGAKLFPPCGHLAKLLARPDVLQYFAYCGGLGAEVIATGQIRIGDLVGLLAD